MRMSRFSLIIPMMLTALAFIGALPGRVISFAAGLVDTFVLATDPQRLADLLRTASPPLAFAGFSDATIDAALATEQRHEAGLKRLT